MCIVELITIERLDCSDLIGDLVQNLCSITVVLLGVFVKNVVS